MKKKETITPVVGEANSRGIGASFEKYLEEVDCKLFFEVA